MASVLAAPTWDPLQYCSSKELSRLDSRFDFALQDVTCLVFWTGVPPELARRWAEEHDLPTLTLAMGPLYSDRNAGSVRYGKSSKAWSRYMKAASGRFAEYACRGGRRAVVLTKPPPSIYSTRKRSNYRELEKPILKGLVGGPGTVRIEYVHPTVAGGADFQYQIWPLDKSNTWQTFIANLLAAGRITPDYTSAEHDVAMGMVQLCRTVVQLQNIAQTNDKQCKAETASLKAKETKENMRKRAELEQRIALEKKEAKRRKSESERQQAFEKREIKRKRLELEQQRALEKKEAKQKKVILEQQKALEKSEIKRRRVKLEQQLALEKKEAKREKREFIHQQALERKEAKRKRMELEQQRALEKKEAKQKKVILEQQKALEKREIKRKRLELEQQRALEKKEAKEKKVILEQQKALEKIEIKRKRMELEEQIALERKQAKRKAS